ncbi:hypothetical protein [Asticcacaulis sp.]|uniref:hypothetical protein n=1 Tax=Asticcacaulis sp. TaxID=1872648 RepID=UPI0026225B52|nr:hypothetical protein [Asticcacaulis sp.]
MTEFERTLQQWKTPQPATGLSDRIAREAMRRPQGLAWREMAQRSLTEWRYGLVYKAAALAACVVIGVGVSVSLNPPAAQEADLDELAFIVGI